MRGRMVSTRYPASRAPLALRFALVLPDDAKLLDRGHPCGGRVLELGLRRGLPACRCLRDALPRALKVGADIHMGDVLSTGRGSRLHVKMVDDAEFSLGERSSFVVQEYFLNPNGKEGNAVIRLMSGAIRATTGKIAQLDNNPFVMRTEVATIGVRGTEFWGGLLDGVHQFALLGGRAIIIENKAGRTEITRVGDGTICRSEDDAPVEQRAWEPTKLDRAAAMTR